MVYSGFNGHRVGGDVLLSFSLMKQGLNWISDAFDAQTKQKALSARRTGAKSVTRRVNDTCICGKRDLSSEYAYASR